MTAFDPAPGTPQGEPFVVVIDTTRGTRHLDTRRSSPTSLGPAGPNRTSLDWVLHALASKGFNHLVYVGGYHIEKVIERYPGLSYRFHASWQQDGEVRGLLLAEPSPARDWLVIRAGTVCVPRAIDQLMYRRRPAVGRYHGGTGAPFAGLAFIPAAEVSDAFAVAAKVGEADPTAHLEQWFQALSAALPVEQVSLQGLAAPADDPSEVARVVFAGKGRTLDQIGPLVNGAQVPQLLRFLVLEWQSDPAGLIRQIQEGFPGPQVIVRSSTNSEDGFEESAAGKFLSILGVNLTDANQLQSAIEDVVQSYSSDGRSLHELDEVLVQMQVTDLAASGVLLTRDVETGAPYYVLNIDRESGRSDGVTSGADVDVDAVYIARDARPEALSASEQDYIELARELEELTALDSLDIEFGVGKSGQIYLFQVRPIGKRAKRFQLADDDLADELSQVQEFIDAHMLEHLTLSGATTVLGTMPDWNPAEMIGTTPRALALSLYQRLIGQNAWSAARARMGYRDVRPEPLIVSLGGKPYVDVRVSLNSLLPEGTKDDVASLWVNHCIRMLKENPSLHDKIEFDVAITCLAFDFDQQAIRLREAGLSDAQMSEFQARLLALTDSMLLGYNTRLDGEQALLRKLEMRRAHRLRLPVGGVPGLAGLADALLADCERFGVLPFSVLARHAFIAMTMLRSLVTTEVFSDEDYHEVLAGIPTIATDFARDQALYVAGGLSIEDMVARYGHLRPSSYDIRSPNYRSMRDTYFARVAKSSFVEPDCSAPRRVFDRHREGIERVLHSRGFKASADDLREYITRAIPAREWAKFEFMKSTDAALETIANLGAHLNFSRDDMSFVPVNMIGSAARGSASGAVQSEFRRAIEFNRKRWDLTCAIRLPHLVLSSSDVEAFQMEKWIPNFVSGRHVIAPPAILEFDPPAHSLNGAIVMIRAADPGYDWIFGYPIAGLVTEFGGAASHMAIRAAEFGLPAAIGCGQLIFDRLRSARLIDLDCASKRIRGLP